MDKANAKQFTPFIFGGDLEEAEVYYKKCIAAFEKMEPNQCRWVYINALANLELATSKWTSMQRQRPPTKRRWPLLPSLTG